MQELKVVKIIRTEEVNEGAWFKSRSGELVIVWYDSEGELFKTFNGIDGESTTGWIPKKNCQVIVSFKYDENTITDDKTEEQRDE